MLLRQWDRLRPLPGGKWLFARLLGRWVPYTGSIRPSVEQLQAGYALVRMQDRRRVRNHLSSIHAVALLNLAEVTSGLALTAALPADTRAILTGLCIDYLKKARGTLTSECRVHAAVPRDRREHKLVAEIRDEAGDLVARAEARWLVAPLEDGPAAIPPQQAGSD
jgi:acyl-coenzyme A thioesterase PaaI-like protein